MVRITVRARGIREARNYIRRTRLRCGLAIRGAAPHITRELRNTVSLYFARQAGPDGPWQPLSERTVAEKGHAIILIRTSRLRSSLVSETTDSILNISDLHLRFGTRVPYAWRHMTGEGEDGREIPVRRFMPEANDVIGPISRDVANFLVYHGTDEIALGRVSLPDLGRGIFF